MPLASNSSVAEDGIVHASSFFDPIVQGISEVCGWVSAQRLNLLLMAVGLLITAAVMVVISWVLRRIVRKLTNATDGHLDRHLTARLQLPIMILLGATGFMISVQIVALPPSFNRFLPRVYYAVISLVVFWCILRVINFLDAYFKGIALKTANSMNELLIDLARRALKAAIYIIAIIFIAQNIFHLNVSALLAGAGVAGLAVAFAAQNTLANIFGAATLILDKPFKVGDMIEMSGTTGVVEAVGLRSTRLRSLDGTVWYVPNRQMADSTLRNCTQRPSFKYAFDIGLVYETTPQQMRRAVEILHEILDSNPLFDLKTTPPRIYFSELRDWSLNISVTVWFQTCDFFAMQEARHEINFKILERFNADGLNFAFPSTTNYLTSNGAGQSVAQKC